MTTSTIELKTSDGICSTRIVTPDGQGPWPAVIFCFDAAGQRATMDAMAERIAQNGYLVAIPDFFHRSGSPFDLLPAGTPRTLGGVIGLFSDPALRATFFEKFYGPATSYENLKVDVGALLEVLAKRPDVRGGVGVTGYCMGGNIAFRIATLFGDRIAAAAAFHGGGLVTATPDSPHLRAAEIQARVLVAGSIEDPGFTDEMKQTLTDALKAARVDATVETYPAKHGYAVPDHPAFDAPSAERHHAALEKLYAATLRRS